MRIGILVCDHIEDHLKPDHGGYDRMYGDMLPAFENQAYFVCDGQFPQHPNECDAWLVGGSHLSVYDDIEWIKELNRFVKSIHDQERIYIGLCFGHQMLAQALDGKVDKAPTGWCLGAQTLDILQHSEWMNPPLHQVDVLMLCQDQVLHLPSESRVLATAKNCPVAMYTVGDRMLGLQGHPEFSKEYYTSVLEARCFKFGPDQSQTARASLQKSIHHSTVSQWITNFINQYPS